MKKVMMMALMAAAATTAFAQETVVKEAKKLSKYHSFKKSICSIGVGTARLLLFACTQ